MALVQTSLVLQSLFCQLIKKCNHYVVFILILHGKALVDDKKERWESKKGRKYEGILRRNDFATWLVLGKILRLSLNVKFCIFKNMASF